MVDATVLLFVRPTNGVYQPPRVVHVRGKSMIEEIGIVPGDMPNIFVEALTVSSGKVHDVLREIAIPPESRVVDVAVEPSQTTYKPGQKATVKVKLTAPGPGGSANARSVPFVGSTVLAVYDKSVEYIAGGSNVPDIKEWFWNWKRSHQPQGSSSLDRWSHNLLKPQEAGMEELGAFGGFLEEQPGDQTVGRGSLGFGGAVLGRGRGMMGGMGGAMMKSAVAPAAAPGGGMDELSIAGAGAGRFRGQV